MKNRIIWIALAAAMVCPAWAQQPAQQASPWPLSPALEKELAAKATKVTEVTLDKNQLGFAGTVMNGNDKNQSTARQFIGGLDGIYVRTYKFDKEGQYSMDDIEKVRQAFGGPEWVPIVRTRESDRTSEILLKQVNGEARGMFILTTAPTELNIVLILGPINMNQLGALQGFGPMNGMGALMNLPNGGGPHPHPKPHPNPHPDSGTNPNPNPNPAPDPQPQQDNNQ